MIESINAIKTINKTTLLESLKNIDILSFDNLEINNDTLTDLNMVINSIELGEELCDLLNLVNNYFEAIKPNSYKHRTIFFWKWIKFAFELSTLNTIEDKEKVIQLKMKTVIFVYALDDICDELRDEKLLNSIIQSINEGIPKRNDLLVNLWSDLSNEYQNTPNYSVLKKELESAQTTILDSFQWAQKSGNVLSQKINLNQYLNNVSPTNCVHLAAVIDLLFVNDLSKNKSIFEASLDTQKMAQIGNWISTWQREIKQNDYSSGLLIYLVNTGYIRVADLNKSPDKIIAIIKEVKAEEYFMEYWHELFQNVKSKLQNKASSEMETTYLNAFKILLFMQIGSVGRT